jgi:hypothetical protein
MGACAAYNRALAMARGTTIASLDSDDLYFPEKLRRQTDFLREHPDVDVCGCLVAEIDASGNPSSGDKPYENWFNVAIDLNDPASWIWQNRVCHSGAMIRSELHRRLGGFAENLTYTPDWQYWIRALTGGARFCVMREPLVAYRNHGANITHDNPPASLSEHVQTLVKILLPWLAERGRPDLIDETLRILARRLAKSATESLPAEVAQMLFSGSAAVPTGVAALRILVKDARSAIEVEAAGMSSDPRLPFLESRVRELAKSADWHAEQSKAWEKLAKDNEQLISQLRATLTKTSNRATHTEEQLRLLRAHWAVRLARRFTSLGNDDAKN